MALPGVDVDSMVELREKLASIHADVFDIIFASISMAAESRQEEFYFRREQIISHLLFPSKQNKATAFFSFKTNTSHDHSQDAREDQLQDHKNQDAQNDHPQDQQNQDIRDDHLQDQQSHDAQKDHPQNQQNQVEPLNKKSDHLIIRLNKKNLMIINDTKTTSININDENKNDSSIVGAENLIPEKTMIKLALKNTSIESPNKCVENDVKFQASKRKMVQEYRDIRDSRKMIKMIEIKDLPKQPPSRHRELPKPKQSPSRPRELPKLKQPPRRTRFGTNSIVPQMRCGT